jgi:hypothetical protein
MKTLTTLAALALTLPAAFAGDLTPPVGPVAPTMKTLDQVEPRVPVQTLPAGQYPSAYMHEILAPGHYYLTADVIADTTSGIRIAASNVTLDLAGFSVRHASGSTYYGIVVFDGCEDVVIRNGHVSHFGQGILISSDASVALIEDMRMTRNGSTGLNGRAMLVRRCEASANGSGFLLTGGGLIQDCLAVENSYTGISTNGSVVRCTAARNGSNGISFVATDDAIHAEVRDNACDGNGGSGVYASQGGQAGASVRVLGNRASGNGSKDVWTFGEGTLALSNVGRIFLFSSGAQAAPVQSAATASHPFANIQF